MALIIERLASQILETFAKLDHLVLIGIERRGVDLARRLVQIIQKRSGKTLPLGTLDINLYRDDWTSIKKHPIIGTSNISMDINGQTILLVDDVLFSGRTIRAAIDALLDYGRPKCVKLLVLIDRGHRELPIQADLVGKVLATEPGEQVQVYFAERDGFDLITLERP